MLREFGSSAGGVYVGVLVYVCVDSEWLKVEAPNIISSRMVCTNPPPPVYSPFSPNVMGRVQWPVAYSRIHLERCLPRRACNAALVAISKTSRTLSFVFAEHSM